MNEGVQFSKLISEWHDQAEDFALKVNQTLIFPAIEGNFYLPPLLLFGVAFVPVFNH